jgi:hypothetical protein
MAQDDDDEIIANLKQHPLFLQEIPEDPEENELVSALMHLDDEGTPEEVAENYKNRGNSEFKKGSYRWDEAIAYYTLAIQQKGTDKKANSIYSNRAAVNFNKGLLSLYNNKNFNLCNR